MKKRKSLDAMDALRVQKLRRDQSEMYSLPTVPRDIPEAPAPAGLRVPLYSFQRRSLFLCQRMEESRAVGGLGIAKVGRMRQEEALRGWATPARRWRHPPFPCGRAPAAHALPAASLCCRTW